MNVRRFLGIPYAAKPARFEPPGPLVPWDPARDATAFGPSAPQALEGPLTTAVPGMAASRISEDCLTLNVWAPEDAAGLPVLFWIHGGAYQIGGSALETYDGERLAAHGAIVVSCNYRVGALGFALLPGHAPNVALQDQLAALRWVQEHISAFGGDPARVCVFGESAGAGCIRHLLAVPARRGLFRRAILQSPGAEMVERSAAEELATRFVEHLGGVAPEDAPVDLILVAQEKAAADMTATMGVMPWAPVIDGEVLPVPPPGDPRDVDVIVGTTSQELALYQAPQELTDQMMRIPATRLADQLAAGNPVTYTYSFEWEAPGIGAAHAVDLPFTFATFDRCGWGEFVGVDDDAWRLADAIQTSWVAFAATGDPSNVVTGDWPRHDPADRRTMVLGRTIGAAPSSVPMGD